MSARTLLILPLVVLAVHGFPSGPASARSGQTPFELQGLDGDASYQFVRPPEINGGSDFGWVDLVWDSWSAGGAVGHGNAYRVCKFDEAGGCPDSIERRSFPVTVRLDRARRCGLSLVYRRMRVSYAGQSTDPYAPAPETTVQQPCAVTLGAYEPFPYAEGFGASKPRLVFLGGDPTGRFDRLHWRGWGRVRSVGRGRGVYFVGPGRVRATSVKLVASDQGRCFGSIAYRHFTVHFRIHGRWRFGSRWPICRTS